MICFFAVIILVLIDQISKFLIESYLFQKQLYIVDNFFALTYVQNRGAAWGILGSHATLFLFLVPVLLILLVTYGYKSAKSKPERIALSFIISGALGNYIDRLFRGYVVDFLDFLVWPVFNFADICIVCGCIFLCTYVFLKKKTV